MNYLKNVKNIILCAGHGAGDPGAVNGIYKEADQTIYIVDRMEAILKNKLAEKGYNLVIVPHSLDLQGATNWINARYTNTFESWNIEIHRDSASGLSWEDASKRLGCYYYGGDNESQAISDKIRDVFRREGANFNTWSRPDTASNSRSLGWIRNTIPVAHLFELAFMQGDNSNDHLNWLAQIASSAIFETLTNSKFNNNNNMNIKINNFRHELQKFNPDLTELDLNHGEYLLRNNLKELIEWLLWTGQNYQTSKTSKINYSEIDSLFRLFLPELGEDGYKHAEYLANEDPETLIKWILQETSNQNQEIYELKYKLDWEKDTNLRLGEINQKLKKEIENLKNSDRGERIDLHKALLGLFKDQTIQRAFKHTITLGIGLLITQYPEYAQEIIALAAMWGLGTELQSYQVNQKQIEKAKNE